MFFSSDNSPVSKAVALIKLRMCCFRAGLKKPWLKKPRPAPRVFKSKDVSIFTARFAFCVTASKLRLFFYGLTDGKTQSEVTCQVRDFKSFKEPNSSKSKMVVSDIYLIPRSLPVFHFPHDPTGTCLLTKLIIYCN